MMETQMGFGLEEERWTVSTTVFRLTTTETHSTTGVLDKHNLLVAYRHSL